MGRSHESYCFGRPRRFWGALGVARISLNSSPTGLVWKEGAQHGSLTISFVSKHTHTDEWGRLCSGAPWPEETLRGVAMRYFILGRTRVEGSRNLKGWGPSDNPGRRRGGEQGRGPPPRVVAPLYASVFSAKTRCSGVDPESSLGRCGHWNKRETVPHKRRPQQGNARGLQQ